MTSSLPALLAAAREASPFDRMSYRDPIAAHGAAAIDGVAAWLADPLLGAFAARVVQAVGRNAYRDEAFAALKDGLDSAGSDAIRRDIQAALVEFAPPARRRPAAGENGYEVLMEGIHLRGRPAIQYRIETHKERGHFNLPRAIMDLLGIPTDGNVDIEVRRSLTGGVVYSGRLGIASGTELYPTADDSASGALRALESYETIDVTVAKAV